VAVPGRRAHGVFGDGTITTLFTPDHAPGHTSVIVDRQGEGKMMLTADACYTMDHYNEAVLPGLIHFAADVADSTRKVRRIVEGHGATFVTGHDPEEWPTFKKAPDYYS
jgi:N-acyl homoserine lactone hydrolase